MTSGKNPVSFSSERQRAEALMCARVERLGAQSPAALMACDTYLAHDFWMNYVHPKPLVATEVWMCGCNDHGELGLGDDTTRTHPVEVPTFHGHRIGAVACAYGRTMVVVDDGELWATGINHAGQLGLEDTIERCTFERVPALVGQKVVDVACGDTHTVALLDTGEVVAWGWTIANHLGDYDFDGLVPTPVPGLDGLRMTAISCGCEHSVALSTAGEVFIWGAAISDGLGRPGDDTDTSVYGGRVAMRIPTLAGAIVTAVTCGAFHTAAITQSGEILTWGLNLRGQLGHADDIDVGRRAPRVVDAFRNRRVAAVACGRFHTIALLETGEVFAWGKNESNQLGVGDGHDGDDPVRAPQQVHFFDDKRVFSVHCGEDFSVAVLESGVAIMWGDGRFRNVDHDGVSAEACDDLTLAICRSGSRVQNIALGSVHLLDTCMSLIVGAPRAARR